MALGKAWPRPSLWVGDYPNVKHQLTAQQRSPANVVSESELSPKDVASFAAWWSFLVQDSVDAVQGPKAHLRPWMLLGPESSV